MNIATVSVSVQPPMAVGLASVLEDGGCWVGGGGGGGSGVPISCAAAAVFGSGLHQHWGNEVLVSLQCDQ